MKFFTQPGTYRITWDFQGQRDNYLKEFNSAEELDKQIDRDTNRGYRILRVEYVNQPTNQLPPITKEPPHARSQQ